MNMRKVVCAGVCALAVSGAPGTWGSKEQESKRDPLEELVSAADADQEVLGVLPSKLDDRTSVERIVHQLEEEKLAIESHPVAGPMSRATMHSLEVLRRLQHSNNGFRKLRKHFLRLTVRRIS